MKSLHQHQEVVASQLGPTMDQMLDQQRRQVRVETKIVRVKEKLVKLKMVVHLIFKTSFIRKILTVVSILEINQRKRVRKQKKLQKKKENKERMKRENENKEKIMVMTTNQYTVWHLQLQQTQQMVMGQLTTGPVLRTTDIPRRVLWDREISIVKRNAMFLKASNTINT